MNLTAEQLKSVQHSSGHALVIAVPGSGKSTSMVARMLYLMDQGVPASRIYCVMFNKAARDEFQEKIQRKLPNMKEEDLPRVKTFHGCGNELINLLTPRYLSREYKFVGSTGKQRSAAREVLLPYLGGDKRKVAGCLDDFLSFVDLVKSTSNEPSKVFTDLKGQFSSPWFVEAYNDFEKKRKRDKVRYFADLIYDPMMEVLRNPKARAAVAGLMDHLIVDEYQDINDIQQQMIKAMAGDKAQVMGVGDPDQCIYAWRGARPDFILTRFHEDFPNTTVYSFTRTFRYGHPLAIASNYVITNNDNRVDQLCVSGDKLYPTELSLEIESLKAPKVPEILANWCSADPSHRRQDAAVLVRNYSHAIPVEISLLNEGIPYRMVGGEPIFLKDEMAAILCALKIAAGTLFQKQDIDTRLVSKFLQIPPLNLTYEDQQDLIYNKMASDPERAPELLGELKFRATKPGMAKGIDARATLWRNLASIGNWQPKELIEYFFNTGGMERYFRAISTAPEQYDEKLHLFETFARYAEIMEEAGCTLQEFVGHIDTLISKSESMAKLDDPVLITSCHRSKGLEWDLVIMAGLSEGRFPFIPRDQKVPVSMEDERRLFYVAMTRARKKLCFVIPNDPNLRHWLGNVQTGSPVGLEPSHETASRFLYESNLFLAQLAEQIVQESRLPAKLKGVPGVALAQRYLDVRQS